MRANRLVLIVTLGLGCAAGCLSPVRQDADALICQRARQPVDALPPPELALAAATATNDPIQQVQGKGALLPQPRPKVTLVDRLRMPLDVPGARTPPLQLPKDWSKLGPAEREKVLANIFPPQLVMGANPTPLPGPEGRPLTLADLQKLARTNSPLLRQAAADIKATEGAAVQAGLYPNPTVGTSTQTLGPGGGPMIGAVLSQIIKTMGKLKLAEAAAAMDVANAQLAYRKAETDLMASVRTSYFAVLSAQASMRATRALTELTDELYKVMVLQLKAGQFATYEPLQIGVLAAQSRAGLITARNNYLLAWKQLAAALGLPAMPATELAGQVGHNLPRFDYEKTLAHVLANHTDVLTTHYTIEKARYQLRLAQVMAVPDVNVQATLMNDLTPPGPQRVIALLSATVPVPLWDRNQGGIRQAQGQLMRAIEEPHRVRAELTARLSDAYRRVEENRLLLELYRTHILGQASQAFRASVRRHFGETPLAPGVAGVALTDLIQAEQSIVGVVGTYLTTLQAYWQAVADLSSLLQTDDVYQMAAEVEHCPLPNLDELLQLPCCHPCSPVPAAVFKGISSFEAPPGQRVAPEPRPAPALLGLPQLAPTLPATLEKR